MKPVLPETPIRFLLNGKLNEVDARYATLTVLDYLRDVLGLTGTKEGCAEGGCGACMVAFAGPGTAGYRAVNSCIKLVGALNGGSLVTIEHLSANGRPHPVQSALADACATQCGFCTPGIVMSLYALYEAGAELTDNEIHYALAGNLCRCTGYRPVLEAARGLLQNRDSRSRQGVITTSIDNIYTDNIMPLSIKDFLSPTSITELNEILVSEPDAKLMAGGTEIIPHATKNHNLHRPIIHLGGIEELKSVSPSSTHIEIGAATPLVQVFPLLVSEYPELEEFVRRFASLPIINVATLGGNLANGSPAGDLTPVLMVLGALLVLRCGNKTRPVNLEDFYTAHGKNRLREREFIERIRIPRRHSRQHIGAYKIARRFEQDTYTVLAAFSISLSGKKVRTARVSYAGMSVQPGRAGNVEAVLEGKHWNRETIEQSIKALAKDYSPVSDLHGSAVYRLSVSRNLLRKFYLEVSNEETISVWK